MPKPENPNLQRPKGREPKTPKMVRESTTPINQSNPEGGEPGKGVRKSEGGTAETGAGVTLSASRISGRGSNESLRGTRKASAEVAPETQAEPEPEQAKESTTPMARRITRAGWRDVLPGDPDPGTGFFRFRAADIPGLPERQAMATCIECFGTDLKDAQRHLAIVVRQALERTGGPRGLRSAMNKPAAPTRIEVQPIAHRATRLCKRARKARGDR